MADPPQEKVSTQQNETSRALSQRFLYEIESGDYVSRQQQYTVEPEEDKEDLLNRILAKVVKDYQKYIDT